MATEETHTGQVMGNYKVLHELGRGAMGTVYAGEHIGLGRPVAIKVLHRHLAQDKDFVGRFLREGQVVAQLNHRKILTVFDIGEHGSTYFIAMERLRGAPLSDVIAEEGPLEALRNLGRRRHRSER